MTEPVAYRPIGIIRTPFLDAEGMPIQATAAVGVPGRIELDAEFDGGPRRPRRVQPPDPASITCIG